MPNPTPTREGLAAEVRGLLAKRRMTQGELAAALGLSRTALSARLNASRPFTVDELFQISDALDADLLALIAGAA